MAATRSRTQRLSSEFDYRQLAILFVCVVAIGLLLISTVVESTSPFLVILPTLIGATAIVRVRRRSPLAPLEDDTDHAKDDQ